jgi:hypothetical protein
MSGLQHNIPTYVFGCSISPEQHRKPQTSSTGEQELVQVLTRVGEVAFVPYR